jgi:hypothetical protein
MSARRRAGSQRDSRFGRHNGNQVSDRMEKFPWGGLQPALAWRALVRHRTSGTNKVPRRLKKPAPPGLASIPAVKAPGPAGRESGTESSMSKPGANALIEPR